MKCRNCGAYVSDWAEYCQQCASDPKAKPRPKEGEAVSPGKGLYAAVMGISLVFLAALLYYFFFK